MAENEILQTAEQSLSEQLYNLLASANPDMDKIRTILEKEPDMITDPDFLAKIFPDRASKPEDDAGILAPNGLNNILRNLHAVNPDLLEKFATAEIYHNDQKSYNLRETLETYVSATREKLRVNNEAPQPAYSAKSVAQMQENLNLYAQSADTLNNLAADQKEEELTVGNTENSKTMKVKEQKTPKAPPETPKNVANVLAQGENTSAEQKEHKEAKWDKIKEKDIIDFMYDDVFLAFVDWCFKTPYMLTDKVFGEPKYKNHEKAVVEKANKSTGNAQIDAARQRCLAVLQLPERKRAEFASHAPQHMQYLQAMYEDIETNAPLPSQMQNWQVVADSKMQETYTRLYQRDPEVFREHVQYVLNHPKEAHRAMEQMYYLASERAAIEWVDAKLKKGKWSFAEKPMEKTEKEIEKRTTANFKQILQERQLALQMAQDICTMEGITDPAEIAKRQREYDENYIHDLYETMSYAKRQLKLDVCEPSSYTDKKRIHDSDKAVKDVATIHDNAENLASKVYGRGHSVAQTVESLKDFAQSFHHQPQDPENFVLEQNALATARVRNQERSEAFHQRLEALLNNKSNPLLNTLVGKNKGRS